MPPHTPPPKRLLCNVGKSIHNQRVALGISTEEFAEQCDTSVQTIKAVEKGERVCSAYTFHKMMKTLALSSDCIWEGEASLENELTELIALLPKDEQRFIKEMITGYLNNRHRQEKTSQKIED